ncbi:imidazole glycerol phosphate synthase subunit HisH [Spirochaetia bacterium]|nr:imidazole glycerol phosphate synthase subunit HisH [Spirochaetia bacterium]
MSGTADLIGVVDYGAGNLGSVMNALSRLGATARFVRGPDELAVGGGAASPFGKVLFPGDGHFGTTMASLEKSGYAEALRGWIAADRPFLGICIGLQVLFDSSEEAPPEDGKAVQGLGVIGGTVKRFPGRKVPQIGWNRTEAQAGSRLFRGLPEDSFFYYIHSFYVESGEPDAVAATADYYLRYCSAVERGNLAAVQFHPEKSGAIGLRLLENWVTGF